MARLTPEQRIEKAAREKAKAEAVIKRAKADLAATERRADTRRKIVLGGALIEAAARDPGAARFVAAVIAGLKRPADRRAFEGWAAPKPPER